MAKKIILEHARDVEYLSISEMAYEEHFDDAEDEDLAAIDALIRSAKVTVDW